RALARAAGRAAHPRRCPGALPDGPGPAARRLGGGRRDGGCPTGGGTVPPGRGVCRRTRLPPFAHDGPDRRIVRPQDPVEQKASYSGKKRDHTVKNVLLVNALLIILFLSDTYGGRTHDKPTVSLGVTYAVVDTYGCDDGRISPTRCAINAAGLDG